MSYTVHQAKTNLSRLIKEAQRGKEVVITRGKDPVAKLVPILERPKKRVPGRLKGLISWEPDAFSPLTEEELREWGL
jgi:prevent-host-death family protein